MLHVVLDAGIEDQPLAGRPDGGHADALVLQLILETLQGLKVVETPNPGGIPDFDVAVMDPEVNRLGRPAADHDGIEAGELQLRGPVAAGLGFREGARQRRLGAHRVAVETGEGGAGNHAAGKDQNVLR